MIKKVDDFRQIMQIEGIVHRSVKGRETIECNYDGQAVFIKKHFGIGWREIFKNLLQLRMPVLGAHREYQAIKHLLNHNIATLTALACGERGYNPATKQSFLITKALHNTINLADITKTWVYKTPNLFFKRQLIMKVAEIAMTMLNSGMNHRDFYLCHFLISIDDANAQQLNGAIYLIDLHRAQIRKRVPYRWLVKDLAALYFSSFACGLTTRDYWRFLRVYFGLSIRQIHSEYKQLLVTISKRAALFNHKELKTIFVKSLRIVKNRQQLVLANNYKRTAMQNNNIHSWQKSRKFLVAINNQLGGAAHDVDIAKFLQDPQSFFQEPVNYLKKCSTTTLITTNFSQQSAVIKRYNIKSFGHALSRGLRPTRAIRYWQNAQILKFLGINTADTLAAYEQRYWFWRKTGFVVTQYIAGECLDKYLADLDFAAQRQVLHNVLATLDTLHQAGFAHGDCKATNFLIHDHQVYVIDLDSLHFVANKWRRKYLQVKDRKRFYKNFINQPSLSKVVQDYFLMTN
jgi:heptose I phosphotransferase